ncbi:MAG: type I secretion protein TolC [Rhodospirillaceae bacterium]|nr:type I secretion protein TolC [Rhodospirillaceae bacterium]|tara:strand:+ start:7166 stop:8533 length:1368 start_codon:yes stop_codon:yes gene_type:complete
MCRRGLLAFSVICGISHSLSASAETLKEALAKAYLGNPNLEAARAELRSVDEGVPEALSGWRPTLTLDYDIGKSRNFVPNTTSSFGESQNRTPKTASVSVEQNVFNGWRTESGIESAEQAVLSQRAQLLSTEQRIMLDTGTSYMDVIRDEAVLKLNQSNERVLRRQLEATRDRFEVGEVTRTDVAQAESRLSRAIADRIQAEGALTISRAAYRSVVGDFPGTLGSASPLGGLPANKTEAMSFAKAGNPDVKVAQHNERSAKTAIKSAEGALYPSVDIEGELTRRDQLSSPDSRTEEASITASFSVPLYQAGGVSARIRAAKQSWSQARKDLDAAIRTAVQEAAQSWERYATARAQLDAFTAEVRAAEIALEGVKQEAQVGSRTVLDVLDAEQELLDARVSLVRARRDVTVASLEVRRAVGTLVASKLDLGVKLYDPSINYKNARDRWFGTSIGTK